MARRKVKLAFIENDTSRKATLKKRRQGLMKKVSELSTLCGVSACAIVYSPDSNKPVFWPSRPEVEQLLVRYRSFSEVERSRKMVNQESYLKEQINKLIGQKKKLVVKNKELENTYLMQQLYLSGKTTSEFANDEMCSLFYYVHEKTKEIERKIELLRRSDGTPRSGGAPSAIEGPVEEEMILEAKGGGGSNNNGDNIGDASSSLDQWFVDIMKSGDAGSGSGSKKDELYPLACLTGGAGTSDQVIAFNLSKENVGVGSGNWANGIGPVNGDAGGSGNNIVLSQGLSQVAPGRGPLVTYGHVGGSVSNNAATPYQGYVGHMSCGSGMMCPNGDAGGSGGDGAIGYGVCLFNQPNAEGSRGGNGEVFPGVGIYGVNNNTGYGMRQHNENPGAMTNGHGVVLPLTNDDHGGGNGGCGIGLNHSNAGVIANGDEMLSTYGDVVSNGYGIVLPPLVVRPIANAGSGNVELGMGMYQGNFGAIINGNNRAIDNGPFEGGNGGFRAMVSLGNLVGNIGGNEVWMLHDNAVVDANGSGGNNAGMNLETRLAGGQSEIVTENDLEHLLHLLEGKEGDMEWQSMMERSTPNMAYQAWRHEPKTGPIIFRSRTVFEDATAEVVRDFFWDDEFRPKWDPMLAYFKTLEECPHTGTMILHWIKKFPFFCSDREYIIGRRIWEAGKTYYCVTKGVPFPGLPKRDKPRRVELYFSSWVIKAVESRKGDGQFSACEVTLVHYEDMGIPKDVAKLGVRHGMWGTVKKLHSGMRGYQNARKTEASLSRSALMARITTKISFDGNSDSIEPVSGEEYRDRSMEIKRHEDNGLDWKWVVIGGTVALVLGLHTGAIGKAMLLGAGNRIARR